MDAPEVATSGTGGGLRYLTEVPAADMVNQERAHSCLAACARQLLADAGVIMSEADLVSRVGIIEGWGTPVSRAAEVLEELHPKLGYAGGAVDAKWLSVFLRRDPWIAALRTLHGANHAVIVDRVEGDLIHVRDPWGQGGPGSGSGSRATIRLVDFLEHWDRALNNAVTPNRRK